MSIVLTTVVYGDIIPFTLNFDLAERNDTCLAFRMLVNFTVYRYYFFFSIQTCICNFTVQSQNDNHYKGLPFKTNRFTKIKKLRP